MKKNCHNCKHLEWASGDVHDDEGYTCNKRYALLENAYAGAGDALNKKLESEAYRNTGKVCFDRKGITE